MAYSSSLVHGTTVIGVPAYCFREVRVKDSKMFHGSVMQGVDVSHQLTP